MSTFEVNGKTYTVTENIKLMTFLRDNLRLLSVKNGCSEGACGTCSVLVDGISKKSCALKSDNLDDTKILIVEGLSEREKNVYSYAFTNAGAVQCGFCTPGMIMSAKALIDEKPDPSIEDIKEALSGNLCRCTGYIKIEEAVLAAAETMKKEAYND